MRKDMSLSIQLLGRPRLERSIAASYRFRSRKSWAVLAYLLLSQQPPTRAQLARLLFAEADDPQRALRWTLAEIRRGLASDGSVEGDPVVLRLEPGTEVDVEVLARGAWAQAVALTGLGAGLLEGITLRGAPAFESWLLSAQHRMAAATEAILHEAALASVSHGSLDEALTYSVRAAEMSPLDENHQALVIRVYGMLGRPHAAKRQFDACVVMLEDELGVGPGPVLEAALREPGPRAVPMTDEASVTALVEGGCAAVAAGAVDAGIRSLRSSAGLADSTGSVQLRVNSRLRLAEALIHSLRGFDEEGLLALYEADAIAAEFELPDAVAHARSELGYVDFLRARYDRAEVWLTDALRWASGSPSLTAKATTYLGAVASDQADYERALSLLEEGVGLSRLAVEPRREAFALSMLGRVHLLRNDLERAAPLLEASIELAEKDHWLAFLPWPQALLGETQLLLGDVSGATQRLRQAFARACQLGDPCWEGMSARGLALLAEQQGNPGLAFELLADARTRCNRLADPYVWLDAYILDAACVLGLRHGHPDTSNWVEAMHSLASRTGMRDLTVRSLLHLSALGRPGSEHAAALLTADIEGPHLTRLFTERGGALIEPPLHAGAPP